jgi:nucleoside-diphosphate-sugar epimerase
LSKLLITGASGFIGHAVTELAALQPEWEVYAVISGRREVRFARNVHVVQADLTDISEAASVANRVRPDILLHLAWNLEGKAFLDSPANLLWTGVSLQLLRTFAECGGSRFVFAGSSAEYGYSLSLCSEAGPANPSDLYGESKLALSNIAGRFCRNQGIGFLNLRFFSVYGVGETHRLHAVPSAISSFLEGRRYCCRGPNNEWDYIYIDDAARACVETMKSDFTGIVNVAGGKPVTMREVFTHIADSAGRRDLLCFENLDAQGSRLIADTSVLERKIGYRSIVDIREGIDRTVAWWKTMNQTIRKEENK